MSFQFATTMMPAVVAALLAFGLVPPVTSVAAQSSAAVNISSKEASKEQKSPVAIEIGEVVKGRLGRSEKGGGYHYWRVTPPPGSTRVVLDVKLANDDTGNLQTGVIAFSPDGAQLGRVISTNELDYRARHVGELDSTNLPGFVLRVGNNSGIVDYWLALFPVNADIAVPYFVRPPKIEVLELGKSFSASLIPEPGGPAEAWYSAKLKGVDYRVSLEFTRADGRSANVQGAVKMFGPLGQRLRTGNPTICTVNTINVSAKCVSKLVLSEDMNVLFRISPSNDAGYKAVFSVEPDKQP